MRKILLAACVALIALNGSAKGRLDRATFEKYWIVESESPEYVLSFTDDSTLEIVSPKGLTLWYAAPMKSGIEIEYDACVYDEREGDRLSDLNCFWMASDPKTKTVFDRLGERNGVFANCAQMQLYYVGYGGNYNSTTRFRRYNGEPGPAIITEYTDEAHLLKANHWYHIKLVAARDGRVEYWIDGEKLVDYLDPQPLRKGWFGFRTTLSRTGIRNFSYRKI